MSQNSVYYLKKLSKEPTAWVLKARKLWIWQASGPGEHSAKINRLSTSDNHSEQSNVRSDNQCSNNTPHPSLDKSPTQTTKDDFMSPCAQESSCTDSILQKQAGPSTKSKSECPTFKFDGRKFASLKREHMFNWLYYSNAKGGYICKICELFAFGKQGETEYISIGVQLRDHAGRKLSKHAESKRHNNAVMRYAQFTSNVNVYKQVNSQKQSEIDRNCEVIKKNFTGVYIFWSGRNGQSEKILNHLSDL